MNRKSFASTALLAALAATLVVAAPPPDRLHYQGVLRDSANEPLDGSYDMVFRFFSAETLGDEILLDRHLVVNGQAVVASDGLFSVRLGDGEILDGSGPGSYLSLADVFANHSDVWLEIQIGAETLSPRLPVASAGYALNAGHLGGKPAADFLDGSAAEQSKEGKLIVGQATGTVTAFGLEAYGQEAGGYFEDTDNTGYARVGVWDSGIESYGTRRGGYFRDTDSSGVAEVAVGDYGISATGSQAGGYFADSDSSAVAEVAVGDYGISASGILAGGLFTDSNSGGSAQVGWDAYGIRAEGPSAGGYFLDADGTSEAYLANGSAGISTVGTAYGGYLRSSDSSGYAFIGETNHGIRAEGTVYGGSFSDRDDSGYAYLGRGHVGIQAYGNSWAGYFDDTNNSGYAYVAYGDWGAYFNGDYLGARGRDLTSGTYGTIGFGTASTSGNGTKNFIQNHPHRNDQVIVYAAPEGNEVATYTRGSARLERGEARIPLDETFAWVTNPALGLTAHVTARSANADLYVAELSTGELVVRSNDGGADDAVFDYMVWGLRIGFEEVAVVREKNGDDAPIPSMAEEQERLRSNPELRKHVALERFRAMQPALGRPEAVDLSSAIALRDAVGVFNPGTPDVDAQPVVARPGAAPADEEDGSEISTASAVSSPVDGTTASVAEPEAGTAPVRALRSIPPAPERLPVAEPVAAGDLLAIGTDGRLRLASGPAERFVVGPASEDGVTTEDGTTVAVAAYGLARVKVDAGFGEIRPGDLLVASPTPGHAMRAFEDIPGTVIGKALESLDAGTGTLRVLIAPR